MAGVSVGMLAVDALFGGVFGVLVEALTDALAVVIIGVVTSIVAGVLNVVNVNVLAAVMSAFRFEMPVPLKESIKPF